MIGFAIGRKTIQAVRRLAHLASLGAWLGTLAGAFLPLPAPQEAVQKLYLHPILADPVPEGAPDPQNPPQADTALPADPRQIMALSASLPDLRTLPPSDLRIVPLPGGRRELRLSNTIWNSGQGPLELSGQFNSLTSQTRVHQRVHTASGGVIEHFVGEFIWHPRHEHWHFEDFTLYELRSLRPNGGFESVVASSDKLSYCVIDTDIVDTEHPAFVPRRNYFACGQGLQGLSPGWGDHYKSTLDGQALDVTGLPDGIYALTSTVNPGGILLETNMHNNRAILLLEIRDGRLKILILEETRWAKCGVQCWH